MKLLKTQTIVALMGCATLTSCLKEDIDFVDNDGTVVTHFYTGPNTPIGDLANAYMYVSGMNNYESYGDIPTEPSALPVFVEPDAQWVAEKGLTVTYDTVKGRRVCHIHPRSGVSR